MISDPHARRRRDRDAGLDASPAGRRRARRRQARLHREAARRVDPRGARPRRAGAQRPSLVLMPGHTFLYSPPVLKIKELLDAGALGDIYFISMSRVNLGLHQPDVSVVWDLGPHDFSILRFWLGMLPDRGQRASRAPASSRTRPTSPSSTRGSTAAPSPTSSSRGSRRASCAGRRSSAREKMIVYDDTSGEPVRIFDSGASLPDPETFGEFQLTYRTGDIVSPKIEATRAARARDPRLLRRRPRRQRRRARRPSSGCDVVRAVEAVDRSLAAGGAPVPVEVPDDAARRGARGARCASTVAQRSPAPSRPADTRTRPHARSAPRFSARGPAGLTAAYVLAQRGGAGSRARGGRTRSAESRRPSSSTATASTSAAIGSSRSSSRSKLWEDIARRRVPDAAAPLAHLLQRPVLRLPAHAPRTSSAGSASGSRPAARSRTSGHGARARREADTFEEWVTQRFGKRLYDAFFRTYTEKVWGIPGSEIRALWAAQRIKNFSLFQAMLTILGLSRDHVTTLIEEFRYPRLGPGQMWEAVAQQRRGGRDSRCSSSIASSSDPPPRRARALASSCATGDAERWLSVDGVVTSLALRDLVDCLEPGAARARDRRGRRPPLPRLLHRRADDERGSAVPGQLDLPPRSRDAGRPRAELRRLERRTGASGDDLPRRRVLLLRGRRDLGDARGRGDRPRDERARADRPDRSRRRSSAAPRCASRRPTRCTTPTTRSTLGVVRGYLARLLEPADVRSERPAPLQQPGSLDVDGGARDAQPPRRHRVRRLVGQHRGRVPRGGRRRRRRAAALRAGVPASG